MQLRNIIFFYCESINPDHEIKWAEKECIEPERTKQWKQLKAYQKESPKTFHKIGWKAFVAELDNNPFEIRDAIHLVKGRYAGQDEGTCVLGMKLIYKRRKIAEQIAQGSITNERFLIAVKDYLIAKFGFSPTHFTLDYGRMD